MSPEQVSVLTALFSVVKALSSWPFALFFFTLVIGPWVLSIMLAWSDRKRQEVAEQESKDRFESVVRMYEDNVKVVEQYEKIASELKDIIIMNTSAQTTLAEVIRGM